MLRRTAPRCFGNIWYPIAGSFNAWPIWRIPGCTGIHLNGWSIFASMNLLPMTPWAKTRIQSHWPDPLTYRYAAAPLNDDDTSLLHQTRYNLGTNTGPNAFKYPSTLTPGYMPHEHSPYAWKTFHPDNRMMQKKLNTYAPYSPDPILNHGYHPTYSWYRRLPGRAGHFGNLGRAGGALEVGWRDDVTDCKIPARPQIPGSGGEPAKITRGQGETMVALLPLPVELAAPALLLRKPMPDPNDPEAHRQQNNVSGDISTTYYPDPKGLYDKFVSGEKIMPWNTRCGVSDNWAASEYGKLKQVTESDVVNQSQSVLGAAQFLAREGLWKEGYPGGPQGASADVWWSSQLRFGPQSGEHLIAGKGGNRGLDCHNPMATSGSVLGQFFKDQIPSTVKATIRRWDGVSGPQSVGKTAWRPLCWGFMVYVKDATMDDAGWGSMERASVVSSFDDDQKSFINRTKSTFDQWGNYHGQRGIYGINGLPGSDYYLNGPSPYKHGLWCNTLQQAIKLCESKTWNWSYEHAWPEAIERDRHALYTDNFPYRGQKKLVAHKAPGDSYWRHEGGNDHPPESKDSHHPETIDHFKPWNGLGNTRVDHTHVRGMSEQELFA